MSATTAERSASAMRRSYSPMRPPSKRSRCSSTVSVRSFSVSSQHDQLGVGRAQAEVRVGDVAGDGDAHRLAVVARRRSDRWLRRAARCGTCPRRRARRTPAGRRGSCCWSSACPAAAAATCSRRCASASALPARSTFGTRYDCASSTCERAASMRASARLRSRLFANASSTSAVEHRIVERGPPVLEQLVLRGGRRARRQVELRRHRLRDRAAGERRAATRRARMRR